MVPNQNSIVRIDFYGSEIEAIRLGDRVWISVRRVCEELGIDADSQRVKLKEKPWACTVMNTVQVGDQRREMFMIDLKSFPMWLAGIEPSRVAEDVREILIKYQKEAADVLYRHFFGKPKETPAEREARLLHREERLSNQQRAKGWALAIKIAQKNCKLELVTVYEAKVAEALTGEKLPALLPTVTTASWKSPTEIAEKNGVTPNAIGRLITSLGIRGNIEGISECRMSKSESSSKMVPQYFYSPRAVEKIENHLRGEGIIR